MTGDVGDDHREAIVAKLQDVVVVAARMTTGAIVLGERQCRMHRERTRQQLLLQACGLGQLAIEPVATAAQFTFEVEPRQVVRNANLHFLGLNRLRDVVDCSERQAGYLVFDVAAG